MKNMMSNLQLTAGQMDGSKARIVMFVLTLVMFVIAAGAPEMGGGIVH